MLDTKCLCSYTSSTNPDVLEWSKVDKHILACGCYELSENKRNGVVCIYRFSVDSLMLLHETKMAGILDLKWLSLWNGGTYLSTVCADGSISLFDYKDTDLLHVSECMICPNNLLLFHDWYGDICAVSASDGTISVVKICQNSLLLEKKWNAHEFEAWTVYFHENANVLLSGSDDCTIKIWDIQKQNPLIASIKGHTSGVCCFLKRNEQMFVSGGFDGFIHTWDLRNLSKTVKSNNVGGQIWRIKYKNNVFLCALIHQGFFLYDDEFHPICSFLSHQSLAYSCDFSQIYLPESDIPLISSCSFYDRNIRIWQAQNTYC